MKHLMKQKYPFIAWIFVIMAGITFQTDNVQANIIDDIRGITIPFVGIRVDLEGTGFNHPQPTCAEKAYWHFKSTDLGQTDKDNCSGQTIDVDIGEVFDNSFIMSVLETFCNAIISTLNWILEKILHIHISPVDFSFKYTITFSNVTGWQKPGKITSYITMIKFKPIKWKPFCIPYWWWGWKEFCFDIPVQFGMSHKAEYVKLKQRCYIDADGDDYGDNSGDPGTYQDTFVECKSLPGKWVEDNTDCDDTLSFVNPGVGDETACNGYDDDCDGLIDEGLIDNCYRDYDKDGCGDPNVKVEFCISEGMPLLCVSDPCDCSDANANLFSGNPEIKCDDIDQDCDGLDDCPGEDCMTISDIPLETMANPAAPLILFVLDDSGSMDQDIMTDEDYGDFHVDSGNDYYYVYNAPDNTMTHVQENAGLWQDKLYYRSQWHEYNKVFYKPEITYEPWPKWQKLADTVPPAWSQVPNADPKKPRSNPIQDTPFDLNQTYVSFDGVTIKRAHYYLFSLQESKRYLVNLNIDTSTIEYYKVNIKAGHQVKKLKLVADPPSDVKSSRSFEDELQNFANWFSFYRRRMHTAKAAIAKVINSLEGVKVGLLTINNNKAVRLPVLPVKCRTSSGTLDDKTDVILNTLYKGYSSGGTPLRKGLENAGEYFTQSSPSVIGSCPYATADDGGECQQVFSIILTDGYWNGPDPSVDNADGDEDSEFDTACFKDSYDNTLADVAMHYYEKDLSSALEDKVPSRPGDINIMQHMVTFTVAFGLNGKLNPIVDYPSCPSEKAETDCSSHCPEWPKPIADEKTTIDDLWHAAVNGRGEYYSAGNPEDLIKAMEMIGRQISLIGSAASVSINGQRLENNSLVFQGSYNSSDWSGDLKAFGLKNATEFDFETPVWSAKEELDKKTWSDRNIITSKAGKDGIFFKDVSGDLLETIHSDLDVARRIVRYISGDDTEEQENGGIARTRYHLLGDIVHSQPLFFKDYVFIGANAGMAHVFDAKTGEEIGAYVPNLVFENLIHLCLPNYSHKYYCDATPTVKETDDGTYLVGGLGKGGKGYYCLKVTEPSLIKMPKWEFPPYSEADKSDDVQMGYSYGTPFIVNSNADKWIAVFGNGYASKRGKAALYIRNLKDGSKLATLDTKSGSYDICNGLSTPSLIDINFDGKVDYAYAGDMSGNLWKFDLSSDDPAEWKIAYGTTDDPQPLFQAKNTEGADGTPQPITSKPDVMAHCVHGKVGYIVIFGTGRYIKEGDLKNMSQQSIYGIWDWQDNDERNYEFYYGSFTKDAKLSNAENLPTDYKKIGLLEQKIESGYDSDSYMVVTDNPISWYPEESESGVSHVGWYFNLPEQHERIVDNPIIREGKVIAVSLIPATSRCGVNSHSNLYILDACNGGRLNEPILKVDEELVEIEPDNPSNPDLPPSVVKIDTVIKPPAFIHTDNGTDMMVFGDFGTNVQIPQIEIESQQGRFYWKLNQ
jgi:type IV pilus assembly protein PilY1